MDTFSSYYLLAQYYGVHIINCNLNCRYIARLATHASLRHHTYLYTYHSLNFTHRAKGKGSGWCVREVREVHALSLTLTHLEYWLTHFLNNL